MTPAEVRYAARLLDRAGRLARQLQLLGDEPEQPVRAEIGPAPDGVIALESEVVNSGPVVHALYLACEAALIEVGAELADLGIAMEDEI